MGLETLLVGSWAKLPVYRKFDVLFAVCMTIIYTICTAVILKGSRRNEDPVA